MLQRTYLRLRTVSQILIAAIVLTVLICPTPCRAEGDSTTIVVSPHAAAPITFGIDELQSVLVGKGIHVSVAKGPSDQGVQVMIGTAGDRELLGSPATPAPSGPESYALSVVLPRKIIVEGSDAVGAMYGAMDLAEQVDEAATARYFGEIHAATKSPYLTVRGVNMFLTTQDIDNPDGAFWSDDYWQGYLGMMARDRYNLLDIHGPLDAVTLTFPNGFAYFVSLPDFPQVGVGPERAARNLERFRQIIRMAADRGIKVAYMNYEATAPIGSWKTRTWGVDERWVARPQTYLDNSRVEEYTRQAVLSFLRQVPELWMFGFRVGESGQPEDFYKKTYLAALAQLPDSLNVYIRTWIADPEKVRELAGSTRHHVYIEPKYNGEHLGLPYQAALGGRHYPPSGSYEDYTDYPKNYLFSGRSARMVRRAFFSGAIRNLPAAPCAVANSARGLVSPWSRWMLIIRAPNTFITIPMLITGCTGGRSNVYGSGTSSGDARHTIRRRRKRFGRANSSAGLDRKQARCYTRRWWRAAASCRSSIPTTTSGWIIRTSPRNLKRATTPTTLATAGGRGAGWCRRAATTMTSCA